MMVVFGVCESPSVCLSVCPSVVDDDRILVGCESLSVSLFACLSLASCEAIVLDYYTMSCDLYHSVYSGSLVVEGYTELDHLTGVLTFTKKQTNKNKKTKK